MIGVGIVIALLLAAMAGSELALRGTKLQTGLARVLVVWTLVYLPGAYVAFLHGGVRPIAFTVFWGGAFLSWFGVRSHVESSILLRMLFLLRRHPMTEEALVGEYTSLYGEAMRREELLKGGLAVKDGVRTVVSPKGKAILGVVAKLR